MQRVIAAMVLLGAIASGASGQRPRLPVLSSHPVGSGIVDRIGPEEIQDVVRSVAPDSRGAIFPSAIDGRAQYILNVRHDASEPERHDEWDDVLVIQHGRGYLDYGGSIKGGKRYSAGEWRGGVITGGVTTLDLAPGVVIRVPARVPHAIRPSGAAPLVYLVLKERIAGRKSPETSR